MPIPPPRLCCVRKRQNNHGGGFGFHLTSRRGRPGQFISSVEQNSPAEYAGLLVGDRVVEVNGVNVGLENHKQVVARIKAVDDTTKLLVVDKVCDDYHKLHEIIVTSSLPHVVIIDHKNSDDLDINMNRLDTSKIDKDQVIWRNRIRDCVNSEVHKEERIEEDREEVIEEQTTSKEEDENDMNVQYEGTQTQGIEERIMLDLSMTAREMREMLLSRKKKDPRKEKRRDMRKRVEMVEAL